VGPCLVLGAQPHPVLSSLPDPIYQQHFKPHADALEAAGYGPLQTIYQASAGHFQAVYALVPKNTIEARYVAAQAVISLKHKGLIMLAADNKAGGGRLESILESFGLKNIQRASKNHARVVWGVKDEIEDRAVYEALHAGAPCVRDGYHTQPGLFSWDRIDRGSRLLIDFIPDTLRGVGADFGCGYGYLAQHVMHTCPGVEKLTCLDADARALAACRLNLAQHPQVDYQWVDLTRGAPVRGLDFIVMNPPFHEGIKVDADIGRAFIMTARASLRVDGVLWLVANAQLPYEAVLRESFKSVQRHLEKDGYKIYSAQV
jgi:16S rRNA (guanine1207-N2)-methyltransferase